MLPLWQEHNFGGSEREVETNIGEKIREKTARREPRRTLDLGHFSTQKNSTKIAPCLGKSQNGKSDPAWKTHF